MADRQSRRAQRSEVDAWFRDSSTRRQLRAGRKAERALAQGGAKTYPARPGLGRDCDARLRAEVPHKRRARSTGTDREGTSRDCGQPNSALSWRQRVPDGPSEAGFHAVAARTERVSGGVLPCATP